MFDLNFIGEKPSCPLPMPRIVSVPNALYKSVQGCYFIGQSADLMVGGGSCAWAALANPPCSERNIFLNVYTVSNFSPDIVTAQVWLNTNPPGDFAVSSLVSPANTALNPPPENMVQLQYVQSTDQKPTGGVQIFERICPPLSTLVSEDEGKIIIPPGGNVVLFLKSACAAPARVILAFGWWEA